MTITPISASSTASAQKAPVSARSDQGSVTVRFAPGEESGPLDRVGSSVMSSLKKFEATRAARSSAVSSVTQGPASAVDAAKAELLSGPASARGIAGAPPAAGGDQRVDHALTAMTRSFDYAIETQLIVKTGSQLSQSTSSLMRGQ